MNETGIKQAEALRDRLSQLNLKINLVYASPLQRVHRTAEIVTAGNYEIILDDRLKERNCGEFEGKPRNLILNYGIDFLDPEVNSGAFGVEPINDMTERVRSFLDELKAKHPDDANILIFMSNGVMLRVHIIITGDSHQDHLPKFANSEIYIYKV